MKAIQISFDETLLERLDATEETRRHGRSAVMRRAVEEYLQRRQRWEIADRYRRAYGSSAGAGDDLEGWADEGTWPAE